MPEAGAAGKMPVPPFYLAEQRQSTTFTNSILYNQI